MLSGCCGLNLRNRNEPYLEKESLPKMILNCQSDDVCRYGQIQSKHQRFRCKACL
ncbi:IS1 family transposase [Xenorhabdus cabanillasii]|uniref:IS1 family transposase n=1 Tax=Xenorhabdus cabanillasii TaxID=351673 RepID=UPI0038CD6E27